MKNIELRLFFPLNCDLFFFLNDEQMISSLSTSSFTLQMSDRFFQNNYPDYNGEQNQVGCVELCFSVGGDSFVFCLVNAGIDCEYYALASTSCT